MPSSAQLQSLTQELQELPRAIVEQLTPLLPAIEHTLQAQRQTLDLLTRQTLQQITQTQQRSQQELRESLVNLNEQISAFQALMERTQAAATRRAKAAQQESVRPRKMPPLTLPQGVALMLIGAILAATLVVVGMHAFDVLAPQSTLQPTHR